MNLVEEYVTNITKVKEIHDNTYPWYEITADFNCYGRIQRQKTKILSATDYGSINTKGYYLV